MMRYYKVKVESPNELSLNTFHYQEECKTGLSNFDSSILQNADTLFIEMRHSWVVDEENDDLYGACGIVYGIVDQNGQLHDFSGKPVPVDIETDYSYFEKSQEISLDAFLASMKQSKQRKQVKDLVQHDTADVSDEFSL